MRLDDLHAVVYACTGVFVPNPEAGWMRQLGTLSYRQDRKRVERAAQRRKVTPEFLQQVADLHNATVIDERIDAVCNAFDVSERTAFRYIAQARERGLLDA